MFHAEIGSFHQFVAVFVKRIGSEPIFQCSEHGFDLCKLFFGFIKVLGQNPIIQVQFAFLTVETVLEVHIVSNIRDDGVGIDGVFYLPRIPFFIIYRLHFNQSAVAYTHQVFRSDDPHQDSLFGFITPEVFNRQPYGGSDSFLSHAHERMTQRIFLEDPAAVPGCVFSHGGRTRIGNLHKIFL